MRLEDLLEDLLESLEADYGAGHARISHFHYPPDAPAPAGIDCVPPGASSGPEAPS